MSDASQQLELADETRARAPATHLSAEFNAFLFSPIDDDRDGMQLTVVSVLARRDLDPWQEAASLAAMPADAATRRLESFIRALPRQSLTLPDSSAIATRLIALLPRRPHQKQAKAPHTEVVALGRRRSFVVAAIVVIAMILLMGAHLARLPNEAPAQDVGADGVPIPSQSPF